MKEVQNNNLSSVVGRMQYILLFLYIVLMYILGGGESFRVPYIPLLLFVIIEFVYILKTKMIAVSRYIIVLFGFVFVCALTCVWALDKSIAMSRLLTVFLLVTSLAFIYNYCIRTGKDIDCILTILLVSGLVLSVYMICFYGFSNLSLLLSEKGTRVGSDINNANTIGMELSITALIAIYYGMKKRKWYYLLSVIPIILSFGTASKKAFICTVLGVLLLIVFNNKKRITFFGLVKKIALPIILLCGMVFIVESNVFPMLTERVERFSYSLTGEGKTDVSTRERNALIDAGFLGFSKAPLGGVGIGNSGAIAMESVGRDTYLHNNYVELLATTGIIGTSVYYFVFISILFHALKNHRLRDASIVITIILLCLVLDWGLVSYYNKPTYIYLLIGILFYSGLLLKNKGENKNALDKENA